MIKVNHQFLEKYFFVPDWKIKHLFLGTFNPKGGNPVSYFYGRPGNFTWPVLSKIFKQDFLVNEIDFFDLLKEKNIACMDMIRHVIISPEHHLSVIGNGYKDSNIINKRVERKYNTRFIKEVIQKNPGIKIYSTWGKGCKLKSWQKEIINIANVIPLVSPSRAARVPKGLRKFDYIFENWDTRVVCD